MELLDHVCSCPFSTTNIISTYPSHLKLSIASLVTFRSSQYISHPSHIFLNSSSQISSYERAPTHFFFAPNIIPSILILDLVERLCHQRPFDFVYNKWEQDISKLLPTCFIFGDVWKERNVAARLNINWVHFPALGHTKLRCRGGSTGLCCLAGRCATAVEEGRVMISRLGNELRDTLLTAMKSRRLLKAQESVIHPSLALSWVVH